MKILSAQHQRNVISGRGFYAAIVENPFESTTEEFDTPFLVISLDDEALDEPNREETFVLDMKGLMFWQLTEKWRGDNVTLNCLYEIRKVVDEQNSR